MANPKMEANLSFIPLLMVIFLAFAVPIFLSQFRRLRLPIVVGEILAGMIVGRSGLGWVPEHDPVLELLSHFGFVFLMFLAGMEIDFSALGFPSRRRESKPSAWSPVTLGIVSFGLTLVLSAGISFALIRVGLARNAWMMALILSTTSLGVVLPVLKERGLSGGRYGQALLITALIADFATMLLITIAVTTISNGLTFEILLVSLLFVAFILVYHFGQVFFNRIPGLRRLLGELSHASAQIKVRAAFTMMLIFVVLSEVLGTEIILGAFLAGAIVALLRSRENVDLPNKLEAIGYGFFIPVFFIMVGVEFNLKVLFASPQAMALVPVLLLAAIVVKLLPVLVFRVSFTWRETLAAGALLSARLSLIIAASAIGLRLGVIGEAVNAAIILVAVLTVTGAPLAFVRLAPPADEKDERPIVVAGADNFGLLVAQDLRAHHEKVVVVDTRPSHIQRARELGFDVLTGDLAFPNEELGDLLDRSRVLICTYKDSELSYRICEVARRQYGVDDLVAQLNEPTGRWRFDQLGVHTINAAVDQAALLALVARNPAVYSLLTRVDDDHEVVEIMVRDQHCDGRRLRELELPGDLLVIALRRDGELILPHGDTRLDCGDHLTLAGSLDAIAVARGIF